MAIDFYEKFYNLLPEDKKKEMAGIDPNAANELFAPYMNNPNYEVNVSDNTVTMDGRPESLPSQAGGVPVTPEVPEIPLAPTAPTAPVTPPVTPPVKSPVASAKSSAAPKAGPDPLDTLIQSAGTSPDQDARNKMLESEKKKHLLNAIPVALGGIGDAIGYGAAAYGGRGGSGTAERIQANLEKAEGGRKEQFEENLKNDPSSQISKHYQDVLSMMMGDKANPEKIKNLSASQIATTLPEVEKFMMKQLGMEQIKMGREQAQASKELALSEKQSQFDSRQWERLGSHVNQLEAGSRKALGVAATANMRADRLLETARDPKASPQDIQNMIADLQGVYKGGVPDQIMLQHGNYPSLVQELAKIKGIITNTPAAANSPEIVNRLVKVTRDIKAVDNMVISSNLGINKVIFRDLINKDPDRWEDLVTQVMGATQTPSEAQGTTPAATTPGASTTTNQPTQIGRFKVTVR